jgi:hypothetical protein
VVIPAGALWCLRSGGFCFGVLLRQSASQNPLGRALCRPYCVFYVFKKLQFIPAVVLLFNLSAFSAVNSPKK